MSDRFDPPPPPSFGPPPASGPPPGPPTGPVPGGWQQPSPPPRRSRRRVWIIVAVVLVVLLGGCTALGITLVSRFADAVRGPVDVANSYLDAARAGERVDEQACQPGRVIPDVLVRSERQQLFNVEVVNRAATVEGTLTLEGGNRASIRFELERRGESWCVAEVEVR